MAYGIKYKTGFSDVFGNNYEIQLLKQDYTGSEISIPGSGTSLNLEMPAKDIYEPINSIGGTIELIAQSDRQLEELYTIDPREWLIYVYRNSEFFIQGFVDPELYEQPLVMPKNYKVSILFNNGLNLLKREKFLQSDGSFYYGVDTAYNVLNTIINKLGMDITHFIYCSDLVINTDYTPPINTIPLQQAVVDLHNYIDEDDEPMSCYEVIETILSPLCLTMIKVGKRIFVIDKEYLATADPEFNVFTFETSTCSTVTGVTNIIDIANIIERDTATHYSIESSFNNYVLTKNRYISPILKIDDLSQFVTPDNIFELSPESMRYSTDDGQPYISYENEVLYQRSFWLCDYTGTLEYLSTLQGIDTLRNAPPHISHDHYYGVNFYGNGTRQPSSSFLGGIKPVKYVDETKVLYDADERDFENYLFVQNPNIPYGPNKSGWVSTYPDYSGQIFKPSITFGSPYVDGSAEWYETPVVDYPQTVLTYEWEPPFISYSQRVLLNLYFTVRFVHLSRLGYSSLLALPFYGVLNQAASANSYFVMFAIVKWYDYQGNLAYILKLADDTITSNNSLHPDVSGGEPSYEWVEYQPTMTTQDMYCKFIVYDTNEIGQGRSIVNKNHTQNIYIPASYYGQIKVDFLNIYYEVWNYSEEDVEAYEVTMLGQISKNDYFDTQHLTEKEAFKQETPLLGIQDLGIDVVYASTLEPIENKDQDIEFVVNQNYKTDKKTTEEKHCTRDNIYINDISGLMHRQDDGGTISHQYITSVSANGQTADTLEDLKGEKYIRHYEKNRVILTMSITDLFYGGYEPFIYVFEKSADAKWGDKSFIIRGITHWDVRNNVIQIELEEL